MDLILLEKLVEELVQQGWRQTDDARDMLLELNRLILKYGYEIVIQSQVLTSSATNTTGLVPPWATPTEKGILCIGCHKVYPDLESYEKHLIPAEGRCDGGKPEPPEPLYDSYD